MNSETTRILNDGLVAAIGGQQNENRDVLENYLKNGGDPNLVVINKKTLLSMAIGNEKVWAVNMLITYKADLGIIDDDGLTPLNRSITTGNITVLKALIHGGANVNQSDKHGDLPLMKAVDNYKIDAIGILIKNGASPTFTEHGNVIVWQRLNSEVTFSALIKAGVDCQIVDMLKRNALHYTVIREKPKAVRTLLQEKKMDPNCGDIGGNTALHLAARTGNLEICKLLLDFGADITIVNKKGIQIHQSISLEDFETQSEFDDIRLLLTGAWRQKLEREVAVAGGDDNLTTSRIKF